MQKTKKILSALLALVMVVGIMPAAAFASPCELEEHTHGEGCYTLTCELSEHSHTACDLSCDKVAHAHCYDDKCEIEAHKHTACDLSCDKEAHAHCYTFTCEKAEHKHNEECADEEVVYVAQIGTTQYETLQAAADVGGSIKLLADVTESVVVAKDMTLDLNGFDVISAGDAFEITAGTLTVNGEGVVAGGSTGVGSWTAIWANGGKAILNGGTYAVGGDSSTTDVTHQNDVIYTKNGGSVVINGGYFENDGTVWTLNENDANRGTIVVKGGTFENWDPANNVSEGPATNFVADGYVSTKNGDNYVVSVKVETEPDAPEVPEEPVTPDIDPDARCGKYEHQHNACDLSCKLYAHTHCHGDTCEIEEHKHTACDLSCDKEEHIHCYPATETPDEPELPEEPEQPEKPEEPEVIVVTNVEATIDAPVAGEAIPMTLADIAFTPDIDVVADDVYLMWAKNADTDDVNGEGWEIIEDEDAVFEDGFYYAVVIFVELPDDVVFADEYTALMNGKAFDDVAFEEGDDEFAPLFSAVIAFDDLVDEEPETPDTPETPDEPETPVVPDVDGYKTNCAKEEHKHTACDLSCDKEAHTHCFSDKCDKDHEHCYVKIEEEPEAPEYSIITGANGTWKDSATDGMTFASDAEFADFVSVKVDGTVVDAANYDAKEGSTVITLKNAYLKTLKEGEHSLTIVSKDGEASTKFTIEHEHKLTKVEAKKETCVDKGNSEYYTCECGKWFKDDKAETEIVDKTSVEIKAAGHKAATEWSRDAKSHWHKCTVCKEAADEKVAHNFDKETGKICQTCKYDVDNPKTGSEAHITVMAVLMTMSVVVMAGVAGYFVWDKKRKH